MKAMSPAVLAISTSAPGIYNEQTAVANSINADTLIRLNNYWYNSYLESMRMYHETKEFNIQKNKVSYEKIMDRLNNHPTARDVENGDALNAVLTELSDPRVSSSALKASKPVIPAAGHSRHPVQE